MKKEITKKAPKPLIIRGRNLSGELVEAYVLSGKHVKNTVSQLAAAFKGTKIRPMSIPKE